MGLKGNYIAEKGIWDITEEKNAKAWKNNLHEAIGQVMMDHFGRKGYQIIMSHPTDYGRSVGFAAKKDEEFIATIELTFIRNDLK